MAETDNWTIKASTIRADGGDVTFVMENDVKQVACRISEEALDNHASDSAGGPTFAFHRITAKIATVANRLIRATPDRLLEQGLIVIRTADLAD